MEKNVTVKVQSNMNENQTLNEIIGQLHQMEVSHTMRHLKENINKLYYLRRIRQFNPNTMNGYERVKQCETWFKELLVRINKIRNTLSSIHGDDNNEALQKLKMEATIITNNFRQELGELAGKLKHIKDGEIFKQMALEERLMIEELERETGWETKLEELQGFDVDFIEKSIADADLERKQLQNEAMDIMLRKKKLEAEMKI